MIYENRERNYLYINLMFYIYIIYSSIFYLIMLQYKQSNVASSHYSRLKAFLPVVNVVVLH